MKKLILFTFLISSLNLVSEEYICSIVWDGQIQTSTYLRDGDKFIYTHWAGAKEKMHIMEETDEVLYLNDYPNNEVVYIVIINKRDNKFSSNYVVLGVDEEKGQEGNCLTRT